MARVIRFDPSLRPAGVPWGRFPRFDEVGAQIDAQASHLFDSAESLAHERDLYAKLEARLAPEDRPLLRALYSAISSHHEFYERAAYLVGLKAGSGRLEGLPPTLTEERGPWDDDPQLA